MKRLKAFILSIALSSFISFIFLNYYTNHMEDSFKKITVCNNSIRYNISFSKYKSHDAIAKNIGKNTILLMGSSELIVTNDCKEHPKQFLDYKDKNIMQVGEGYFQSIIQAVTLGSIGSDIPIKTVNLILSMQWFDKDGIKPEAFLYRFSIDHLNNLYKNPNISDRTKEKIYNRILELSKSNSVITNIVKAMKRNNMLDKTFLDLNHYKYRIISNYKFFKSYHHDVSKNTKKFPKSIDWNKAEVEALESSISETDNNKFYMHNEWYDKNIGKKLEKFKNSAKNTTFTESPEYKDLQLFLDVAKDMNFKVNLVLVPLQGYWADYTGVSHREINNFYENIKKISKENSVNLIDYSAYSYKPYFFKDATHLGRLGLLQLQKDLLEYNKD